MGGRGAKTGYLDKNQHIFEYEADKLREVVRTGQAIGKTLQRPEKEAIPFRECCCCKLITLPLEMEYTKCCVCGWIDDPFQNGNPDNPNGRNGLSLNEAKENYKRFGTTKPK
ncbi:hypothetical protein SDC9_195484 [bioreactor metagenome]|jgi:hypothetical protein|uniref:Cysteine-rich CPCC domain-containing protein n=1 Tax=bioreactor metagenome TaxID=1076179 RepID=A0A645I9U7_9ZZZZ